MAAIFAGGVSVNAPFPYFGGKRTIADDVWKRLGSPKQYIEPFCGTAAMLLAKPDGPAALEVICDQNGFIANFWRAVKHQPDKVAEWADYPVSHIDLGARHKCLMESRQRLGASLQDPDWPGDAKVAGWWLWGQCCWIGSGWCDWSKDRIRDDNRFCNLRVASHKENMRNVGIKRHNKTGAIGVDVLSSGRFRARINQDGKNQHLGVFDTIEEAESIAKLARIHWGEYYPC
jgi:hypothetical protein